MDLAIFLCMFEQVAQKRMETMSETNVVHFLGHPVSSLYVYAYNATKGGVHVLDAMIASYLGKPAFRRWPTAVFFFLLGVAEVNASILLLLDRGQGQLR